MMTFTMGVTVGQDGSLSLNQTITGEGTDNRSVVVPAGAAAYEVEIAFRHEHLDVIAISTSVDLTLETNDTGASADDTFTLSADEAFIWTAKSGVPNPFTADVTKFLFTDADATADANVKILCLRDATPAA